MLGWFWPEPAVEGENAAENEDAEVTVHNCPLTLDLPPGAKDMVALLGETSNFELVKSSDALLMREKGQPFTFSVRCCSVWNITEQRVVDHVLQTKQMYEPHSRDASVFVNWLQHKFGVRAVFDPTKPHRMLLSRPPVRSQNAEGEIQETHSTWVITPALYTDKEAGLEVWVLKHGFVEQTTLLPKVVPADGS